MKCDYLTVTYGNGEERFMIWNRSIDNFEAHNGSCAWKTWSNFRQDFIAEHGNHVAYIYGDKSEEPISITAYEHGASAYIKGFMIPELEKIKTWKVQEVV